MKEQSINPICIRCGDTLVKENSYSSYYKCRNCNKSIYINEDKLSCDVCYQPLLVDVWSCKNRIFCSNLACSGYHIFNIYSETEGLRWNIKYIGKDFFTFKFFPTSKLIYNSHNTNILKNPKFSNITSVFFRIMIAHRYKLTKSRVGFEFTKI